MKTVEIGRCRMIRYQKALTIVYLAGLAVLAADVWIWRVL